MEGLQAWSRNGFSADWSPLNSVVAVGDFNADGRSDVFLQGVTSSDASYLLYGHVPGAIFATSAIVKSDTSVSADAYRLMTGQFTSKKGSSLYAQSLSSKQLNFLAGLDGGALVVTQPDASLAAPTSAAPSLAPAGPGALALLTATSVGRTPGQFAVSATGAATYQIPIWTPPGARGIEPHLALTYASDSPDGNMGPGWNLSGLSSIVRCNKTFAKNGVPAAVTLTTSDNFCLDGNRLRLTGGTYGAAGSTYQTQIANFSNVTAVSTAGNGPASFTVQGKDGLTYEYGNTVDSKAYTNGGSTPYAWMLNKVRDRQGNNMVVVYSTTSGSVAPITIQYTQTPSTNGTTYPYTVSFTYQTRVKTLSGYIAGSSIQKATVLANINVKSAGVSVRQYRATYVTSPASATQRDRLASIQECAGSLGTDCLRATLISYQDGAAGVNVGTPVTLPFPAGITGTVFYDFNGDGKPDLVYANGGLQYVMISTATGYLAGISTGVATTALAAYGDLTGTGKDGIVANNGGTWWYYSYNGTAFVGTSLGFAPLAGASGPALVDTEGKGLPNLVMTVGVNIWLYVNTSSAGVPSFNTTANLAYTFVGQGTTSSFASNSKSVRSFDFNGDGRQDLMGAGVFTCQQNACKRRTELIANGLTFNTGPVFDADVSAGAGAITTQYGHFNSDACTDFVYNDGLTAIVYLSPCNGGTPAGVPFPVSTVVGTLDWDGDGRSDLLVANGTTIGVYKSTETGLSALVTTTIPFVAGSGYSAIDVDGDGLGDLIIPTATSVSYRAHNGAGTPADLATNIADGYGVAASPLYVSIVNGSYTKGAGAVYPDQDYIGPQYVTKLVNLTDGISASGTYSETYTYTNARQDLQGMGFEGFQTLKVVDSRASAPVRIRYFLNGQNASSRFPLTGMVYQDDVYQSNGTTLISSAVITNVFTTLDNTVNNKRYFPYTSVSATTQYEVGGTKNGLTSSLTTKNYTFDTSGNATTVATTTKDTDAGSPYVNQIWGSTTTRSIAPNAANWCLGLPTQVQVVNTAPGVLPLTRTVGYTPDYVNCRESQQIVEPLSATYKVTEVFGFDSIGNISSDAITGIGMTARTTTTNWGTTGQFPMTVTNPLTQVTQLGYNFDLGLQTSQTDPNGILTSRHFDPFGRVDTLTRPDGTSTGIEYKDCASVTGGCQNGDPASAVTSINKLVVIATQKDSSGTAIRDDSTYLDQLDRPIVTKVKTLAGGYSRVGTQFDALGHVYRSTVPCDAASCTAYWVTNLYDTLNRLTQQQRPTSASNSTLQTTTFAYLGCTSTVTDPQGKVTTKIAKVTGALGRSQDHNGYYQDFGHDAFGSLLSVTDSLSNALFSATYDYGQSAFQRTTSDMDLGGRTYNYNALGELTSYSDAKSQNFSFTPFDALGRPTTRTEPDLTTTWTWGASAASHNIGRLASVATTGGSVYSESYAFDSVGRLSNDTKQGLPFDYTYNVQGTIDTLTYPTSTAAYRLKLQYLYQNGLLQQVKDFNATTVFCEYSGEVDQGFWSNVTGVSGGSAL